MLPEKLSYLAKYDSFYQAIVNNVKEAKINEAEFYLVMIAKTKAMNKERILVLNKEAIQG